MKNKNKTEYKEDEKQTEGDGRRGRKKEEGRRQGGRYIRLPPTIEGKVVKEDRAVEVQVNCYIPAISLDSHR